MSKKNSHRDYKANRAAMESAYRRLLSCVASKPELHARVMALYSLGLVYGLDDSLRPCQLGYTGAIKHLNYGRLQLELSDDPRYDIVQHCSVDSILQGITVHTGEDIHDVFENHRPGSCMRHAFCRDWLRLYANNPKDVGVMKYSGSLTDHSASWLIWFGKNGNYFDKAYYRDSSSVVQAIKRRIASHYHVDIDQPPKQFKLKWIDSHRLPYMDTLRYCKDYSIAEEWVRLSSSDCGPEVTEHETGWHPEDSPEDSSCVECTDCSNMIDTEDGDGWCDDWGHWYCSDCYGMDGFTEEVYPNHELTHVNIYSTRDYSWSTRRSNRYRETERLILVHESTLENNFVYSEKLELWILSTDSVEIDGDYGIVPSDNVVEDSTGELRWRDECVKVEDEWYHEDSEAITLNDDGEWTLISEMTSTTIESE